MGCTSRAQNLKYRAQNSDLHRSDPQRSGTPDPRYPDVAKNSTKSKGVIWGTPLLCVRAPNASKNQDLRAVSPYASRQSTGKKKQVDPICLVQCSFPEANIGVYPPCCKNWRSVVLLLPGMGGRDLRGRSCFRGSSTDFDSCGAAVFAKHAFQASLVWQLPQSLCAERERVPKHPPPYENYHSTCSKALGGCFGVRYFLPLD